MAERYKDLSFKDKTQYIMAILLIVSGIAIAFLSFFLNAFTIETGVLIYIAQSFITAGGIFGVSIYFKSKLGEFSSSAKQKIEEVARQIVEQHTDEHHDTAN